MKNVLMIGMVIFSSLALVGCGDEEIASAVATGASDKNLFSNWVYQDGSITVAIDFTGVHFGSQTYSLYLQGGGACVCMMNISGSQSSGTIILASCLYDDLGQGGADPGCSLFDSTSSYTKTVDALTLCESGASTCYTYH